LGEGARGPRPKPLSQTLSLNPLSYIKGGWGGEFAGRAGPVVLRQLPPYLMVYGIEGRYFGLGQDLSPEVARSTPEVTRRIWQEIQELLAGE